MSSGLEIVDRERVQGRLLRFPQQIRELQKKKRALAEGIFGEEKFSQSLDTADFNYLLSD